MLFVSGTWWDYSGGASRRLLLYLQAEPEPELQRGQSTPGGAQPQQLCQATDTTTKNIREHPCCGIRAGNVCRNRIAWTGPEKFLSSENQCCGSKYNEWVCSSLWKENLCLQSYSTPFASNYPIVNQCCGAGAGGAEIILDLEPEPKLNF